MKQPLARHTPRSSLTPLLLALAGGSLTSACSGHYPLGDVTADSHSTRLVDGSIPLAETLAPPDFTLDVDASMVQGSLAFVGDLDGDGRDDIAEVRVSATQALSVHVRYGGPRPANDDDVFAFDHSGGELTLEVGLNDVTLAPAGDVDGDGYADLLVHTSECAAWRGNKGAYLVYGGPERLQGTLPLREVAAHFVPPPRAALESVPGGFSCGGDGSAGRVGDLDGDGIDDLVITTSPTMTLNNDSLPNPDDGAYVFYGRTQRFSVDVLPASADALLHSDLALGPMPLEDVNGDGRADLLFTINLPQIDSYFVPGQSQRYSGTLELPDHSTLLAGATPPSYYGTPRQPMDLDGDGIHDLLLSDDNYTLHVFYGRPGLFQDGVDFSQADAILQGTGSIGGVGDRDGDGKDELLDLFNVPDGPVPFMTNEVAFARGSSTRLSGSFSFPESEVVARSGGVRFPADPKRLLELTIPGGDLDGDGAADLFTVSSVYHLSGKDGNEATFDVSSPQLHVHYGLLEAGPAPAVR